MSLRTVPGTGQQYHLICFDKRGAEVPDADGSSASGLALAALADPAAGVTDVFIISHGWQGDLADAIRQYDSWIGSGEPGRRRRRDHPVPDRAALAQQGVERPRAHRCPERPAR